MKKIFLQSQPNSDAISLILNSSSPLEKGPWIINLNLEVQNSSQNLTLLSGLALHQVPLSKIYIPFFIAFHVRKVGKDFPLLDDILLHVKYFFFNTWDHRAYFFCMESLIKFSKVCYISPFGCLKPKTSLIFRPSHLVPSHPVDFSLGFTSAPTESFCSVYLNYLKF